MRRYWILIGTGVLLLGSTTRPAAGQEPERAAAAAEPRWNATVDLAFSGSGGNQRIVVFDTGFRVAHLRTDLFELEWTGRSRYGRSDDREVARNMRGGMKFDLYPTAEWSPFVFTTAERDPFRQLAVRASGGMGMKRTLWRAEVGAASISLAALYSYEDYDGPGTALDPAFQQNGRMSWRFRGQRRFSSDLQMEHTFFYQPIWDRPADYLADTQTALRVRLGEGASITVSHNFERDATPRPGVRRDDHLVKAGVTFQTRW